MRTVCKTCMHQCELEEGKYGICGVRRNRDGRIVSENYGMMTAMALDPIEKKPLKLFYPGSMVLSVGSFGCNLKCPFCQNHEISMIERDISGAAFVSPGQLVSKALEYRNAGNIGVAYTYNEPLVGWEYVRDVAKLVKESGMKNVLVTNGSASLEVLEEILPYIDAMNIDLKGFHNDYYRRLGGDLQTVKAFIARAAEGCHVELTTLIVPGENDSISEMEEEAKWIASLPAPASEAGQIPLHVTRFFPRYHMTDKNATDVQRVYQLADTAREYLQHVFVGNC